jgi:hypothetical protein
MISQMLSHVMAGSPLPAHHKKCEKSETPDTGAGREKCPYKGEEYSQCTPPAEKTWYLASKYPTYNY